MTCEVNWKAQKTSLHLALRCDTTNKLAGYAVIQLYILQVFFLGRLVHQHVFEGLVHHPANVQVIKPFERLVHQEIQDVHLPKPRPLLY